MTKNLPPTDVLWIVGCMFGIALFIFYGFWSVNR